MTADFIVLRHFFPNGIIVCLLFNFIFTTNAQAAHPLITDDAGTQGVGKFQFELNAEYSNDNGSTGTVLSATFSTGLMEGLDLVTGFPYIFLREKDETGEWKREHSISDLSLAFKWRFLEHEGLSLALKPGITLATGDEDKGLGDGKPTYSLFLIGTKESGLFFIHLNLGYIANRKEARDIWHYSLAGEYAATDSFKVVVNLGGETNPDRGSSVHPLFVLGGMIYEVTEGFDIDFGVKTGLNRAEADYTLFAGIALRF